MVRRTGDASPVSPAVATPLHWNELVNSLLVKSARRLLELDANCYEIVTLTLFRNYQSRC